MSRARPSVEALVDGVRGGDRALLARAITLVESRHPDHRADAEALPSLSANLRRQPTASGSRACPA